MLIQNIHIEGFRNIQTATKLAFHPQFNIFLGDNGSGKTSLLESIYFLALGRSFRTNKINNLINFKHDFAAVHATYTDRFFNQKIKISSLKYYNQHKINKIGGTIATGVEVANLTPTQLINDETSKLIFKEPDLRRKFLDWLAFYSNKNYQNIWKEFQITLQQRNKVLKQIKEKRSGKFSDTYKILNNIDIIFVELSTKIMLIRQHIWKQFQQVWLKIIQDLHIIEPLITELKLFSGWNGDLSEQLLNYRDLDVQQGFTHYGPHKADLQFKLNGKLAKEILSRGQGKLAAFALILARTKFIKDINLSSEFVSVLLIDDLSSELDEYNINKIITALSYYNNNLQVFITGSKTQGLLNILSTKGSDAEWFEISKGRITQYKQ